MIYVDLTIAIGDDGPSWRGKYTATLVDTTDLDADDKAALEYPTGYGDTPLEAARNLLALAVAKRKQDD